MMRKGSNTEQCSSLRICFRSAVSWKFSK